MQNEKREIYKGRSNNFENNNNMKQDENISAKTKDLILQWQNSLFASGCKKYRVGKVTGQFLNILKIANYKDIDSLTINDLILIVSK